MPTKFRDYHELIANTSQHYNYAGVPEALSGFQEWMADLLRWVALQFQVNFHAGQVDSRLIGDTFKVVIYGMGIVASFLVLCFLLVKISQYERQKTAQASHQPPVARLLTSKEWLNESERLTLEADWRAASRSLYMACLRLFDEDEIVPFNAARTNIEYFYALKKDEVVQKEFRQLASLVDGFWFGEEEAHEEDFRTCRNLFQSISTKVSNSIARSTAGV